MINRENAMTTTGMNVLNRGSSGSSRRAFFLTSALLSAGIMTGLIPGRAEAQSDYPTQPVRIVVPFGPGGIADTSLRIVAEKLTEELGQQVIVENQPGAGGIAAASTVRKSEPDGHTLALLSNGTAISVPLFKDQLPFDPLTDFAPVSSVAFFDFVLATNAESAFGSMADVLAASRATPGGLNVGTINIGSSQNLAAELLKSTAGVDFTIVTYRQTPDLLVGLLRSDVDLMIDNYAGVKAAIDDGRARALATTGAARTAALPDVPTVQESGVDGFEVTSWNGIFAPAATPTEVIDTLNQALHTVLAMPDIQQSLLDLGIEGRAGTPEELQSRLQADIAKWGEVIAAAGIERQ
jgi:tripartite-type tricarboxylate transporter receptor subunit TctC